MTFCKEGGSGTGLCVGSPVVSSDRMVVVTGGPPLTLLLIMRIVLRDRTGALGVLGPLVIVLDELPLITVTENSGIWKAG